MVLPDINTPYYILDVQKLKNNYSSLKKALDTHWPGSIISYSFKTNSLPFVLNWMREQGAYAEVVSEPEYRLGLELGFAKEKFVINGPVKGEDALRETLENGAVVNLDSFHEISWLAANRPEAQKQWNVGLRINFDLEAACPGETIMGEEGGRFGFNLENGSFDRALALLKKMDHVKVTGLHGHNSTKTKSLKIFSAISKKLAQCSAAVGNRLDYIDIGGCMFGDKPGAPTYDEYIVTVKKELEKSIDTAQTALIVEPGAALIASPFRYVCTVLDVKEVGDHHIVTTDGSAIHIDPQFHNIKFGYELLTSSTEKAGKQIVSGFTCIEKDRILYLENETKLEIGDRIVFHNNGAYSMALSPLFIQYFPAVTVLDEGSFYYARIPWTTEQYLENNYTGTTKKIEGTL